MPRRPHLGPAPTQPHLPRDAAIEEVEPSPGEDMLDALARGAPSGAAATLLASLTAEPPWLDWGLLARGQDVYLRHLPSAGLVLFNVSLIGGFSAPKITKVLEQSGYLVGPPKLAMRRLFDTGRLMVDACANGPDALRAGGVGWRAAVRVRALHAKVRRRLLRRGGGAEPGSGGGGGGRWDVETYGVPINQEDMAATLLAFSYNVLVGVEAIRGEELPEAEQEAFLHLWRYMGHLLGVAETHNPCAGGMRLAKARLESIILHLLQPDELSVRVATHLLKAPYAHLSAPRAARGFELSAQMTRLLVGDELGDALGLPFVPRARARARRTLRVLRFYGRACESWLLGRPAWSNCPSATARVITRSPPHWPIRLLRAALWARETLWAREERPRRLGAEERLWQRSATGPTSPMSLPSTTRPLAGGRAPMDATAAAGRQGRRDLPDALPGVPAVIEYSLTPGPWR